MSQSAPEDGPIRLNSSSQCNICCMRRRHYCANKKGSVIAFCDICDADADNPITYTKKVDS